MARIKISRTRRLELWEKITVLHYIFPFSEKSAYWCAWSCGVGVFSTLVIFYISCGLIAGCDLDLLCVSADDARLLFVFDCEWVCAVIPGIGTACDSQIMVLGRVYEFGYGRVVTCAFVYGRGRCCCMRRTCNLLWDHCRTIQSIPQHTLLRTQAHLGPPCFH